MEYTVKEVMAKDVKAGDETFWNTSGFGEWLTIKKHRNSLPQFTKETFMDFSNGHQIQCPQHCLWIVRIPSPSKPVNIIDREKIIALDKDDLVEIIHPVLEPLFMDYDNGVSASKFVADALIEHSVNVALVDGKRETKPLSFEEWMQVHHSQVYLNELDKYANDFRAEYRGYLTSFTPSSSSAKEVEITHKTCGTKSAKGSYIDGVVDYLCPKCNVTFLDNEEQTVIS